MKLGGGGRDAAAAGGGRRLQAGVGLRRADGAQLGRLQEELLELGDYVLAIGVLAE